MVTAIADGSSRTEQPQRRPLRDTDNEGTHETAAVSANGTATDAADEAVASQQDAELELLNALHLAREGEMAAAERAEKKRRRGMSEARKKEESGRYQLTSQLP